MQTENIANSQFSCYCDKGTNYRYVEQSLLIKDDDIPVVFQALRFPQRFSWGLWCFGMVIDVSKECGTSTL